MAKTYNNLYPAIYNFESLHAAYLRARRGKRTRAEVQRFELDLEGNLIVAGINKAMGMLVVLKFDQNGNLVWNRQIPYGPKAGDFYDLATDAQGSVYVVGGYFTETNQWDLWVIRLDPSQGGVLWEKKFGGPFDDIGHGVKVSLGGNVYITGEYGVQENDSNIWLLVLNPNGSINYDNLIGSPLFKEAGLTLALDPQQEETVYIAGTSQDPTVTLNNKSMFLLKSRNNFYRGDADDDGAITITDAIFILDFLFLGNVKGLPFPPAADINNDGQVLLSDALYLLNYLFRGGPEPPQPFPFGSVPPRITDVRTGLDPALNKIFIEWQTDEPSDSRVLYGVDDTLTEEKYAKALTFFHRFYLDNLEATEEYSLAVESSDFSGNKSRDDNQGSYYRVMGGKLSLSYYDFEISGHRSGFGLVPVAEVRLAVIIKSEYGALREKTIRLRSNSPYIAIQRAESELDIPSQGTGGNSAQPFIFSISSDCPPSEVIFTVDILNGDKVIESFDIKNFIFGLSRIEGVGTDCFGVSNNIIIWGERTYDGMTKLYAQDFSGQVIHYAPEGKVLVDEYPASQTCPQIDGTFVYWDRSGLLFRRDLAGQTNEELLTGTEQPLGEFPKRNLAVSGSKMVWECIENETRKIYAKDLSGGWENGRAFKVSEFGYDPKVSSSVIVWREGSYSLQAKDPSGNLNNGEKVTLFLDNPLEQVFSYQLDDMHILWTQGKCESFGCNRHLLRNLVSSPMILDESILVDGISPSWDVGDFFVKAPLVVWEQVNTLGLSDRVYARDLSGILNNGEQFAVFPFRDYSQQLLGISGRDVYIYEPAIRTISKISF